LFEAGAETDGQPNANGDGKPGEYSEDHNQGAEN
jgi:hypothetical protein